MDKSLQNLGIIRPVAKNTSEARRQTDWTKLSNENLKFMLDLLSLHFSPFEVDCANEVQRRIVAGIWLDMEKPPPPSETINYRGFLPYLAVLITLLAGVLAVGWWLLR